MNDKCKCNNGSDGSGCVGVIIVVLLTLWFTGQCDKTKTDSAPKGVEQKAVQP